MVAGKDDKIVVDLEKIDKSFSIQQVLTGNDQIAYNQANSFGTGKKFLEEFLKDKDLVLRLSGGREKTYTKNELNEALSERNAAVHYNFMTEEKITPEKTSMGKLIEELVNLAQAGVVLKNAKSLNLNGGSGLVEEELGVLQKPATPTQSVSGGKKEQGRH